MENFLRAKEYWSVIKEGIDSVPAGTQATEAHMKVIEEQQLKDRKKFKGSTRVKRAQLQTLKTEFELLRMKEGETVNAYFGHTLSIAKRIKACGEVVQEREIMGKILRSLVPKFNYVVCSIEESNNVDTLTVDELQSSLLIHEQRMKNVDGEEQVLLKVTHEVKADKGRGEDEEEAEEIEEENHSIKLMWNATVVTILVTSNMNVLLWKNKQIMSS
eukprot:XP_015577130.1 uncharacterized protein LOC107261554 [Ricinus communis]